MTYYVYVICYTYHKKGEFMECNRKINQDSRILKIYSDLIEGHFISKNAEAERYRVSLRSIQRDIEVLRNFLEERIVESGIKQEIIYDRKRGGYYLKNNKRTVLTAGEALAVIKILLDSRAFEKEEFTTIINRIIECCVEKESRKKFTQLIRNEQFHYVEPQHKVKVVDRIWQIGTAITNKRILKIEYQRKDKSIVERLLQPLAIVFSEFYFYLTAVIDDKTVDLSRDKIYPTIYRIDRIKKFEILDEHFTLPYENRFQEGEFRNKVQFMYSGPLKKVEFYYTGEAIEAVLDRLPTAKIVKQTDGRYLVTAESYGNGIDMWLKSQGNKIEIVKE